MSSTYGLLLNRDFTSNLLLGCNLTDLSLQCFKFQETKTGSIISYNIIFPLKLSTHK